jgi:hypothetical protein
VSGIDVSLMTRESGRADAHHVLTKPLRKEQLLVLIKISTGEG